MRINTTPRDPFDPEAPVGLCEADIDQQPDVDSLCQWDGQPIGAQIDSLDDLDAFLLQGPLDGAFSQGQSISLTVEADGPILAALTPAGSPVVLAVAHEIEPGRWVLAHQVPEELDGRYLQVQVVSASVLSPQIGYELR